MTLSIATKSSIRHWWRIVCAVKCGVRLGKGKARWKKSCYIEGSASGPLCRTPAPNSGPDSWPRCETGAPSVSQHGCSCPASERPRLPWPPCDSPSLSAQPQIPRHHGPFPCTFSAPLLAWLYSGPASSIMAHGRTCSFPGWVFRSVPTKPTVWAMVDVNSYDNDDSLVCAARQISAFVLQLPPKVETQICASGEKPTQQKSRRTFATSQAASTPLCL